MSSVCVMRAPVLSAMRRASLMTSSWFQRSFGATIRTSMPIMAPATRRELPMLFRASPQ